MWAALQVTSTYLKPFGVGFAASFYPNSPTVLGCFGCMTLVSNLWPLSDSTSNLLLRCLKKTQFATKLREIATQQSIS